MPHSIRSQIVHTHPYDSLPGDELDAVADAMDQIAFTAGAPIYRFGEVLDGLYLILSGEVDVHDEVGAQVSYLGPRNSFGERGLMRDGLAATSAQAATDTTLLLLPRDEFRRLYAKFPAFQKFFTRTRSAEPRKSDVATVRISEMMTPNPIVTHPEMPVGEVARLMRDRHVSSVMVVRDHKLAGIVTTRDLTERVLAEGLALTTPVGQVMTENPATLDPSALGSDVLHTMMELGVGHLPITRESIPVGIITQTDLTRFQALSSAQLVYDIAAARDAGEIAKVTTQLPRLLAQLVGGGNAHEVVTRLITDIADAATRRLMALAQDTLGPPPVPYAWLACGSQGRQEQTGVSDQDNCLFISDDMTPDHAPYFEALAQFVSDGLHRAGYVYCPGDMMATNPKWRQPVRVWRQYFDGWINTPDAEAQMLASVMFDLRVIGGDAELFEGVQADTLARAAKDSIFVAHMIANSLKHVPPLGMLRGFATIRSGEHKNQIDLKHNGVVPVVDLGRVYALKAQLTAVNTRSRLEAAEAAGVISHSGAHDLLDAYDLIAQTRLDHQARLIRQGEKPDNFMSPTDLSDFERSHLRDAFVVIRTMQSAAGQAGAQG